MQIGQWCMLGRHASGNSCVMYQLITRYLSHPLFPFSAWILRSGLCCVSGLGDSLSAWCL